MAINYDAREFVAAGEVTGRRPFTRPVLEELKPGTPRYEAAKAAIAKLGGGKTPSLGSR